MSDSIGNITQVTRGGREIALEDISIQIADLPAANRLDEVRVMTGAARFFEALSKPFFSGFNMASKKNLSFS